MPVEANLPETNLLSLNIFLLQMHNKKMLDLENEGQSDGAQHPQLCHSMANIKISKRLHIFAPAFTISEVLSLHIFYLANLGQGHGVQHS